MIALCCKNCKRKVQWVILGINLGLFLVKGSFAVISHSKSLLTDSFQSLANFIITLVVIASMRLAARDPDERFPYGYGKIEFLASSVVNMALMLGAIVFILFSFLEMGTVGPERPPKLIAIFAAVISIIANMLAYRYGRCAGEKLGSSLILANAEVSRADVGTSIAVIVAVVGCNLGFSSLDHIVAIVIGAMIVKVTLDGAMKAFHGLLDVSLRGEEMQIFSLVEDMEGVHRIGDVKVRLVGRELLVDMNIFMPGDVLLGTGLETGARIKKKLQRKIKTISEVSIQLLPMHQIQAPEGPPKKARRK